MQLPNQVKSVQRRRQATARNGVYPSDCVCHRNAAGNCVNTMDTCEEGEDPICTTNLDGSCYCACW